MSRPGSVRMKDLDTERTGAGSSSTRPMPSTARLRALFASALTPSSRSSEFSLADPRSYRRAPPVSGALKRARGGSSRPGCGSDGGAAVCLNKARGLQGWREGVGDQPIWNSAGEQCPAGTSNPGWSRWSRCSRCRRCWCRSGRSAGHRGVGGGRVAPVGSPGGLIQTYAYRIGDERAETAGSCTAARRCPRCSGCTSRRGTAACRSCCR